MILFSSLHVICQYFSIKSFGSNYSFTPKQCGSRSGGLVEIRGEQERLFGSREREGKLKITFPFYGKGTRIRKCYGKGNTDSISRPMSRPKLPFPGNGKGNLK